MWKPEWSRAGTHLEIQVHPLGPGITANLIGHPPLRNRIIIANICSLSCASKWYTSTMRQGTFFDSASDEARASVAPLAVRMRPRTLDEFVGQEAIVGEDTWLRRVIAADALSSILLFGPAGTGKTSLARIIAASTEAYFDEVSAIGGTVADLRKSLEAARNRLAIEGKRTILFIDEIHRFSKSQQDALLHAVEDRIVVLIGATTENPYFEVNSPLVSRSRVIELGLLRDDEIEAVVRSALLDERGLGRRYVASDEVITAIAQMAGGDARVALTTLELASQLADLQKERGTDGSLSLTLDMVTDAMPSKQIPYDKGGDYHYDVISAFIKSMRGSDPDGAVYWLAVFHFGKTFGKCVSIDDLTGIRRMNAVAGKQNHSFGGGFTGKQKFAFSFKLQHRNGKINRGNAVKISQLLHCRHGTIALALSRSTRQRVGNRIDVNNVCFWICVPCLTNNAFHCPPNVLRRSTTVVHGKFHKKQIRLMSKNIVI